MTDDPLMKASEAPLMDHLVELRTRLLKSLFALAITFAFCFYFADFIFVYLLSPYEAAALAVSPNADLQLIYTCLLYTSPSPRDRTRSRMPSSA